MTDSLFFRCIKAWGDLVVGEVYPAWRAKGELIIALSETSTVTCHAGDKAWLKEHMEVAAAADFDASIQRAMHGVDEVRVEQGRFMQELSGFNTELLGSGDAGAAAVPVEGCSTLQTVNPAGRLRNRAHSLKRQAGQLSAAVKEKKEWLEAKLGQKLALAMASLGDMQGVIAKLEEVVQTVQLYLGRDEEIVCVRDGEPATAETPLCIRQNVLYMDEETALQNEDSLDCTKIELFDQWLISDPAHLAQVIPEQKGVVVLQVRRKKKEYQSETLADAIANAEKDVANRMSYWLVRNGDRLHRIHAEIFVGERLIPRLDELDHFFFERQFSGVGRTAENVPLRPGSRAYMEAMESANAIRRHYMRLAMVLQGLIDRTLLFAPYKDGARPNLLDPEGNVGTVNFLRDVEGTITDGRPTFSEWLEVANAGLQHGHRIVGHFATWFSKDQEQRLRPRGAGGVNDGEAHVVIETREGLHFAFKRTDEIYRRRTYRGRGDCSVAKTAGTYVIYRGDRFFVCIDSGVTIEEMEYYLTDRRHRHEYEYMVPCLKQAIAFKRREIEAEKPFRALLLRKLDEATPGNPCSLEQLDRLILWWKTKTKEHRALLAEDSKAYRMIIARHTALASDQGTEADRTAFLEAVNRMPDAIYAFHAGGRTFGVLRSIDGVDFFLKEETWKVTRGTAHCTSTDPFVLAQKADYETYGCLYSSPAWRERPAIFRKGKFLSPIHYPALVEFVKANPWFTPGDPKDGDEHLVAIYAAGSFIRAASIAMRPKGGGWRPAPKRTTGPLDMMDKPDGNERVIAWTSGKTPEFRYRFDYSSHTHIDHSGEFRKGWEGERAIFVDETVIAEVEKQASKCVAHNRQVRKLEDWIREATDDARAAFKSIWTAKQLAKYREEGGDPEFFEDHLKTITPEEVDARFVAGILSRAIEAGKMPAEIAGVGIDVLAAAFPPAPVNEDDDSKAAPPVPADLLARLVSVRWAPPAPSAAQDE